MSSVLGVIAARGGSKGIPRKNLALLAGKPLLSYTCEAARGSTRLSRVVVSTDDAEIADASRELGVEVLHRPEALALDDTPMLEVVRHAARSVEGRWDVIVLLQPTSPLRQAGHIDAAVDLLLESGADTVVSVIEVPHQFAPQSLMRDVGGRLVPAVEGGGVLMRQQKARLLARNGPAVLATRTASLLRQGFYEGDVRPLVMEPRFSVDIDDENDLRLAEFWLSEGAAVR